MHCRSYYLLEKEFMELQEQELFFSVKYNIVPPVVTFSCIPFHPNVDPVSGRPCIDFLDNPDLWDKNYTLSSILLSIQRKLKKKKRLQTVKGVSFDEYYRTWSGIATSQTANCFKIPVIKGIIKALG
ncbi:ubiquitin-conjugating enzyme E2 U [Sarcophilus harrisii]